MNFPALMEWLDTGNPVALARFASRKGGSAAARSDITITAREHASSTTDGTSFNTGTFTPTANKLQILDVASTHGTTAETPSSITGCGLTWVLVDAKNVGTATTRRVSRWRALGASPSNGALTINFSGSMTGCVWAWNEVTGMDTSGTNGSGAFVQTVTKASGGSVVTLDGTLAALENAKNVHICAVALNTQATVTPDADFAELGDDNEATLAVTLETQWAVNQTVCDATFSSAQAATIASEIKAGTS